MRTINWPERSAFIAELDVLMRAAGIRHDSALAEAAGIAHTTPGNWRSGKTKPSMATLAVIAPVLKVKPKHLAAIAGLLNDDAEPAESDPLPDQFQRLAALYRLVDDDARGELLRQLDVVAAWFESTILPSQERRAG